VNNSKFDRHIQRRTWFRRFIYVVRDLRLIGYDTALTVVIQSDAFIYKRDNDRICSPHVGLAAMAEGGPQKRGDLGQ
jgi:hypothetical protein